MSAADHAARQTALYQDIWLADPSYGTAASDVTDTVVHRIGPHVMRVLGGPAGCVVDFGAGDGRFLAALKQAGLTRFGIGVDVYRPQLPEWMRWEQGALWDVIAPADYVISTDTLEHLPKEHVWKALSNMKHSAPHGFLRISTKQDIYGTERGLHLHETVEPPEWWLARISDAGIAVQSYRVYPKQALEVWF